MYPNYASPQRPIVASNNLVKKDFSCSKKDMKQDLRYLQLKTATFTQTRISGATNGGQASNISSHKERLEADASCFNLKKNKSWPIIFIALSTKNGRCNIYHRP